jgi:tryptophan-rich sensory protein
MGAKVVSQLKNPIYLFTYVIYFILLIIFLVSYLTGIYSTWYLNLKTEVVNVWIPRILWFLAIILSYVSLYLLWNGKRAISLEVSIQINAIYIISELIIIAWSVIFLQGQNILGAIWLSFALLIFQIWLLYYVWKLDATAGLYMVPLVLMYLYLLYSMIHLASINGVK